MTIRRSDTSFSVEISGFLGKSERNPARKTHITLARKQALAGEMYRDQGGGTRSLNDHSWASEIQFVRSSRGQEILVVSPQGQREARGIQRRSIRGEYVQKVGVQTGPGMNPDQSTEAQRIIAGVLERLPSTFEEYPLLWIHPLSVSGSVSKERSVESVGSIEDCLRFDISGIGKQGRFDALFDKLVVRSEEH